MGCLAGGIAIIAFAWRHRAPLSLSRSDRGATIRADAHRPALSAALEDPRAGRGARRSRRGPPAEYREGDLDADFFQTPYGLFALGAQALRAGHQVKVINLSGLRVDARRGGPARARRRPLRHVVLDREPPRRGARRARRSSASTRARTSSSAARTPRRSRARCSRTTRPSTPSAIGESEQTFLELLDRLAEAGSRTRASPGRPTATAAACVDGARARRHRGPRHPRRRRTTTSTRTS